MNLSVTSVVRHSKQIEQSGYICVLNLEEKRITSACTTSEPTSIFVFPLESKNFPIVLLEAMAVGMAIITTKDTGCVGG